MDTHRPAPTERQVKAFKRFLQILPHGKDRVLVVLKAHLLIEEQVRQIVDERITNPKALADARLDCHQCICLAQAFFQSDSKQWLWTSLKKLNKIRNDIAHNIEPKGLQDRLSDFVEIFPTALAQEDETTKFEMALWSLFVAVSDLVENPTASVVALKHGTE
jgi:hypothetical protein